MKRDSQNQNLTLPLTVAITPLDVAMVFVEGTSSGSCPAHSHRDGPKKAKFILCAPAHSHDSSDKERSPAQAEPF